MAEDSSSTKGVSRGDSSGTKSSDTSKASGSSPTNSGPAGGPSGPNSGASGTHSTSSGSGSNAGAGGTSGGQGSGGSHPAGGNGTPGGVGGSKGGTGGQTSAGGKTSYGGQVGGNNNKVGGPGAGGMGANNVRNGSTQGVVGPNSGLGAPGNIGNSWSRDGKLQDGVSAQQASFQDHYDGITARSDNAIGHAMQAQAEAARPAQMAEQYGQYRSPPGAAPRTDPNMRDPQAASFHYSAPMNDITRNRDLDIEAQRGINAASINAAMAAGQSVPTVETAMTTNDLYGRRPSTPGSATAAEQLARTNFGYDQIGALFNDPAINPALPTAIVGGLWNQRIQDATRLAADPKYKGTFGERDLAPWDDAGFRTKEEAAANEARKKGIKESFHNYGLAADITAPDFPGSYKTKAGKAWGATSALANEELASLIENDDVRWGGTFKDKQGRAKPDPSHFQLGTGTRADAISSFGSNVEEEGLRADGTVGPTSRYGNERPATSTEFAGTGHIEPASIGLHDISDERNYPGADGTTGADLAGGFGDDGVTDTDIMRSLPSGTWTQSYDRPSAPAAGQPERPSLNSSSAVNGGLGMQGYGNGLTPGEGVSVQSMSPPRSTTVPDWRQSTYTGREPTEVNVNGGDLRVADSYDPLGSISAPERKPQDRVRVVGGAGMMAINDSTRQRGPNFDASRYSPRDRDEFYGGGPSMTPSGTPDAPPSDKPSYIDPITQMPPPHLPEKKWPEKLAEKAPFGIGLGAKLLRGITSFEYDRLDEAGRERLMEKWSNQNHDYLHGGNLGGSHAERSALLGGGDSAYVPRRGTKGDQSAIAAAVATDTASADARRYRSQNPLDYANYGAGPAHSYFYYA